MPKLEVVNANNVIEYSPQKANFKLKNTGGPKGEPGAQGPKGDTGPQGPAGPQGIQGEKGDKGAQGERGPQGIQGPQGLQGIQGPKGDKGDKGNTGATGPQGPQGPAGQDGTDGFSPIATVTQEGLDAEISITDKDGTTTATVPGFGVQVVESLPATGSSNIIYLERDSNSASGNPISIADAVEAPLKSLEIQGNTTQNGTPTPDAPVAVQTVTGENVVKICGKNLFDIGASLDEWFQTFQNGLAINSYRIYRTTATILGGKLTIDSYDTNGWTWISKWVLLEKNTRYIISGKNTQVIKIVGFNSKEVSTGGTLIAIKNTAPDGGTVAFDTGDYNYYAISFYPGGANNYIEDIQLEKGSTPTAYEPYQGQSYEVNLGNIELCKIGTYQDYIYKSGDKWYVRKETQKIVLNGSESWTYAGQTNVYYSAGIVGYALSDNAPFADYLKGVDNVSGAAAMSASADNSIAFISSAAATRLYIKSSTLGGDTTGANLRTWLSAHNITLYYALATPTDTEITNEALVAQLEAILAGGTQAGANNIMLTPSAGATGTLKVEYYDSYDSYLWVNNRWEKFAHLG